MAQRKLDALLTTWVEVSVLLKLVRLNVLQVAQPPGLVMAIVKMHATLPLATLTALTVLNHQLMMQLL